MAPSKGAAAALTAALLKRAPSIPQRDYGNEVRASW
eukprot:gene42950-45305_t